MSSTTLAEERRAGERPWWTVLRLAVPAVGENVAWNVGQTLMLIIAGVLGPAALAGVGATEAVRWFVVSAVRAMGTGVTALVARRVGAERYDEARRYAAQAIGLTVGTMTVVALIMALQAERVLAAMGLTPEVIALSAPYTRLAMLSIIPQTTCFLMGAVLKALGDTRTPMLAMATRSATVVLLSYVLVDGKLGLPVLGLPGIGLALVVAWTSGLLPLARALGAGRLHLSLAPGAWRDLYPRWETIRRVLAVAVPAGVEEISLSGGQLVFTRILTSLGTVAYAAHLIGFNIAGYGLNVAFGFAVAASTLVGQNLGARRPDRARALALWSLGLGVSFITLYALILVLAAGPMAGLFTADAAVVAAFRPAAPLISLSLPALGVFSILAGGLRGAGDTRGPMVATVVSQWTLRLVVAYTGGIVMGWGLPGVWAGWVLDQWVRATWISRRFRAGRWLTLEL